MIESAAGQALVNPGCRQHSCGDVKIPYPFGIGVGCYMNTWFEVSCGRNETPKLTSVDIEVLYFSLDQSTVAVKRPIIANCSGAITGKSVNLSGSPFMSSLREELSFRPSKIEYVQDMFTWMISEEYASQLPHTYPDAFRCFQPNISSYPYSLVFDDPYLDPNGAQLHNSSMPPNGSRQCACEPGFQGNPYLPFGCKGKLFFG
ncbi:hypothetical protein SLEP1_g36099 [Rubroshorea leprosula]|uniref:Wall-associated receptor kinase galacturonan-binding domain-containing protein n=1 Tax=Rubroshorea leprosula TaxID=152421 RepID=A0AAV5KQP2_9ROSI|nr:hypothetical protein SLEP1_g36099 [Rubroshorea leprosula]